METIKEDKNIAKKKIGIFIFGIGILIVLYIVYYSLYASHHIKTENAYTTGDQNVVTAQVSGNIINLRLKNTEEVKKGQLVAKIEDINYKLALEEAKLNLVEMVRNFYSVNTKTIQARESLNSAQSDYNTVNKEYQREIELFKSGLISRQKMEATENNYTNTKNALTKAKKQHEDSKLQSKSTDIESYPSVATAILRVKKAYFDLSRTKIYSPSHGQIAKKAVYLGETVEVGQQLFIVVDLAKVWVEANLKETQLKNIVIGNPVTLKSDINNKTYDGVVIGISAGSGNAFSLLPAQNATGNWIKITQRVPVRIALTKESLEKNGTLPLGSTMDIDVDTSKIIKDLPVNNEWTTYNPYALDDKAINGIIEKIVEENSMP